VDYQLGLFKQADRVMAPFFVKCPTITPITLGQKIDIPVLGGDHQLGDAYYSLTLAAGDYEVYGRFRRTNKDQAPGTIVTGSVERLDADGGIVGNLIWDNSAENGFERSIKLSLADPETIIFKIRASDSEQTVEFSVKKWQGD
jgi:hypothetical protein